MAFAFDARTGSAVWLRAARRGGGWGIALLLLTACGVVAPYRGSAPVAAAGHGRLAQPTAPASAALHLDTGFLANVGQYPAHVAFATQGKGGRISVAGDGGITFELPLPPAEEGGVGRHWVLRERLRGSARASAAAVQAGPQLTHMQAGGSRRISSFASIGIDNADPRLGLQLVRRGDGVEKLLTLAPGTDPAVAVFELEGNDELHVDDSGRLQVRAADQIAHFSAPVAYQDIGMARRPVSVAYRRIDKHRYAFRLGRYDRRHPVTIDPVLRASYLGGIGREEITSVAVAADGRVFAAGKTCSIPFPGTSSGVQTLLQGSCDAVVARFSADLGELQAATYLGGAGDERIDSLVVSASGAVYVAGWTTSVQFPGSSALNIGAKPAVFVTALQGSLAALDATQLFLATSLQARERVSLATAASADLYVATTVQGTPFAATTSFLDHAQDAQTRNAWLARVSADLQSVHAAVYFGGDSSDTADALVLSGGKLALAGVTLSTTLPGIDASSAQSQRQGYDDAYVANFAPDLSAVVRTTLFGGGETESEQPVSLIAGIADDLYLAGYTRSFELPGGASVGGFSYTDAFVARLSADLSTVHRSLMLSGDDYDGIDALVLAPTLGLYAAGTSWSSSFPATANGAQAVRFGSNVGFAALLPLDLSGVQQSTYLGGSEQPPTVRAIAATETAVIVAGWTEARDLPDTAGAAQPALAGTADGLFVRLSPDLAAQMHQPPVAVADSFAASENTLLDVPASEGLLLNDSDPEGHALSARLVDLPLHGSVVVSYDGSFRYVAQYNYDGIDRFTYRVWDGALVSAPVEVVVHISGTNQAPSAYPRTVAAPAGGHADITLEGEDVELQPLIASVVDAPQHGSLTRLDDRRFRYTPAAGFEGDDFFNFRVSDGALDSEPARVDVQVRRPPAANDDNYSALRDTPLTIPRTIGLKANDALGYPDAWQNRIDLELVEPPSSGTLVLDYSSNWPDYEGNTGGFTYTPAAGFTGPVTFRYRLEERLTRLTDEALVTINVLTSNAPPLAHDDSYTLSEDGQLNVDAATGLLANDSDPEGSPLTVVAVEPVDPDNVAGHVSFRADGSFDLYARQDAHGHFEFRYTVRDLIGTEASAILSVDIQGSDDPPLCQSDCYVVVRGQALVVDAAHGMLANDTEPDGQSLSVELETPPQHGSLQLAPDGSFTFTPTLPAGERCVYDVFNYRASDGGDSVGPIAVSLHICEAIAPQSDSYGVAQDMPLEITDPAAGLLANDAHVVYPDQASDAFVALETEPQHGSVLVYGDGTFSYTPDAGYSGSDSFTYRVSVDRANQCHIFRPGRDKAGGAEDAFSATAQVILNIGQDNTPPQTLADSYALNEDETFSLAAPGVLANDSDADGDTFSVVASSGNPGGGSLVVSAQGAVQYTPPADASGEFAFRYTVRDAQGASADGDLRFVVSAVNDAPRAVADSYGLSLSGQLSVAAAQGVLANDSDVEGQALSAALASPAQHGSVNLAADGSFVYTAAASFAGEDSFRYTASDGEASSPPVTVQIRNRAPQAAADHYVVASAATLSVPAASGVLANDVDPEGQPLSITLLSAAPPGHFLAFRSDGGFDYRSPVGFVGSVALEYAVSDGLSVVSPVRFTIEVVTPVQAGDDEYALQEDETLSVTATQGVLANDSHAGGQPLVAQLFSNPLLGTAVLQEDGSFVYTPRANAYGTDTFRYAARHGNDYSVATVTLQIGAVADQPIARDDSYQGEPGEPIQNNVLYNDSNPDAGTLTAILVQQSGHGLLNFGSDGQFRYTPAAGFSGQDSFIYRVASNSGLSSPATVQLRINSRPVAQNDSYAYDEDGELVVAAAQGLLANDSDAENDALSVSVDDIHCSDANYCSATFELQPDGSFRSRSNNNFNGWISVRYRVFDGSGYAFGEAFITIRPVNDAPQPSDDSYIADADATFTADEVVYGLPRVHLLINDVDIDGDELTTTLVQAPERGSLVLSPNGRFSYTPERGFLGRVSFIYAVSDGVAPAQHAQVQLDVTLPPLARPDNYRLDGGSELRVVKDQGLLINDTDEPEYDELRVEPIGAADVGQVELQPDGAFRYVAPPGYRGIATFRYRVSDGYTFSLPATVSIRVGPSTVPFATNDEITLDEDAALALPAPGVLANDEDDQPATLTAAAYCPWSNQGPICPPELRNDGSLAAPAYGSARTRVFEYYAYDGVTFSNRATVTVNVTTLNDPPRVNPDLALGLPGQLTEPLDPLFNDVADDGFGPLRATLLGGAAYGAVSLGSDRQFRYLPQAGFHGRDSVAYRATDTAGVSTDSVIDVIIDTPPAALDDHYSVAEDTTLTLGAAAGLLGNDSDAENDALQVVRVSLPGGHAFTSAPDGSFEFTPRADFTGLVRGEVTVSDGLRESRSELTIQVLPGENHAPKATANGYQTPGATALRVSAAAGVLQGDYDPDGHAIHAELLQSTGHGALEFSADGSFVYTPAANFQGYDHFVYAASDGLLQSEPMTVSILVNTAPVAAADALAATEDTDRLIDTALELLGNDHDPDQGSLTATLRVVPVNGTITQLGNGQWRYRANANYFGVDRFSYSAYDGFASSPVVEVGIVVAPVDDDAPTAILDVYQLEEDGVLDIPAEYGPLANDVEVDTHGISASLIASPPRGELQLSAAGALHYVPVANDYGDVEFTYRATDPTSRYAEATVRLRIHPVNDRPVAFADRYDAIADRTLVVNAAQGMLANDSDVDSATLQASVIVQPQHGRIQAALDGSFSYLPDAGYLGPDQFRYQADDGAGGVVMGTVDIDVRRPNQPPTAQDDAYTTPRNSELQVDAAQGLLRNDRDPDGDALRAELALAPAHGSVTIAADGAFRYLPTAGFSGSDSFRYRVVDASGLAATARATISVTTTNTAPQAQADAYSVAAGAELTIAAVAGVLANDSDGEGDFLSVRLAAAPLHGSLELDYDGAFRYRPAAGYSGSDSFHYIASDGVADSGVTRVSLSVNAVNSAPLCSADHYPALRGLVSEVAPAQGVLANDSDANGDSLQAELVQAPAHGTLEFNPDGSFRYTAGDDFVGDLTFRYRCGDGQLWSAAASVTLTVGVAADAPVAHADRYAARGAATIARAAPGVLGNDLGWQSIAGTARLVTAPAHGSLQLQPDGSFQYTLDPANDGDARFTYRIVSPRGPSDVVQVDLDLSLFRDGFDGTGGAKP